MSNNHSKRRFFRYSLRTLFLVVTVFCILMGTVVKRARDQRLVVAAIRAVGGAVRSATLNQPCQKRSFVDAYHQTYDLMRPGTAGWDGCCLKRKMLFTRR